MGRRAMRVADVRATGDALPEKSGQTFIKGAVLVDNAGFLEEGGANPTNIVALAAGAGHNTDADGDKDITFVPVKGRLIEASIDDSGDLGNGAIADADLHNEYAIVQDADGVWYVDKAVEGANGRFRITKFKDAVGTTQGRVYGFFSDDATILNQT